VTAATTTLRIRFIDKPPSLLLRLATRYRAPLALAILFSKCISNDSFGSSQKPSHFVTPCFITNDCLPIRTTASVAARRTFLRLLNSNSPVLLTSGHGAHSCWRGSLLVGLYRFCTCLAIYAWKVVLLHLYLHSGRATTEFTPFSHTSLSAGSPFGAPLRYRLVWSLVVRTLYHVVFVWLRAPTVAFDGAFVFTSFVFASADKALRLFCALAEVVTATAAHTHSALTSFPEPFRLISPRRPVL
jgi:hypothetical protein